MDRQDATELLDDPLLPEEMVAEAYRGLELTHRWLGNTAADSEAARRDPLPVRKVLDIGCGQGALLLEIRRKLGVEVVGVDLRPAPQSTPVPILLGDAVSGPLPPADVALAVCMAHHLSEDDLIRLIRNVSRTSRRFILLDLVRNRLPLVLFRTFVCPFLPAINVADGLTSIHRSYIPRELRKIVDAAVERAGGGRIRHTVAPLYIRQIVDIRW